MYSRYIGCVNLNQNYNLFTFQQHFLKLMQSTTNLKRKPEQYRSIKDQQQQTSVYTKKPLKNGTVKLNSKIKSLKIHNHSQSKSKVSIKINKNNQNCNQINIMAKDNLQKKNQLKHTQSKVTLHQQEKTHQMRRVSSEKLIKSKSMTKLLNKNSKMAHSPSPISSKDIVVTLNEQKQKIQKNLTSRTEKEKKSSKIKDQQGMKKSKSKIQIPTKRESESSNRNRLSIKTQISSKMPSVFPDEQKNRQKAKKGNKIKSKNVTKSKNTSLSKYPQAKKEKCSKLKAVIQRSILYSQVSFQQINDQNPYTSALISNHQDKYFLPYPANSKSVKTEGCQLQKSSNLLKDVHQKQLVEEKAAILIQKYFRGYIIRKYINEAKYIISKVKLIQNWWRNQKSKKSKTRKVKLSLQNSLITVKDFNDSYKNKKSQCLSESKDILLSSQKNYIKDALKNIVGEELDSNKKKNIKNELQNSFTQNKNEFLNDKMHDKIPTKDVYIQKKLSMEISSEKIFNSPKNLSSPNSLKTPTNSNFNLKEIFNNSCSAEPLSKIKQFLASPRRSPRLKVTPQSQNNFEIPSSSIKEQILQGSQYHIFETSFAFIEEFCLSLIEFLREEKDQMNQFMNKIEGLKYKNSIIMMKNWNKCYKQHTQNIYEDSSLFTDYFFQSMDQCNSYKLFPQAMRQKIFTYPSMLVFLSENKYQIRSEGCSLQRHYLNFIFNVLEEGIFQSYKNCYINTAHCFTILDLKSDDQLFEHIFSQGLANIHSWAEMLCGAFLNHPERDEINNQRMIEMIRKIDDWDRGNVLMNIKLEISSILTQSILDEMAFELIALF